MNSKFFSYARVLFVIALIITNLPAEGAADAQATLRWDPVDPDVEGYRLYHRIEGQNYNYSQFIDAGTATSETVRGLEENTTYYFVVRAYAGQDLSFSSNEVAFNSDHTTPADPSPPSQPEASNPEYNATDIGLQPELASSAYHDPDAGDEHTESRWQIYRLDNDELVLDLTSGQYLTEITVPPSVLDYFTAYYWTVSHINQNGASSLPSARSYFTTIENQEPISNTSSNLGGGDGSDGIGGAGCFIGSTGLLNP